MLSKLFVALIPLSIVVPGAPETENPAPLTTVAFVGASVTAGFGSGIEFEYDGVSGATGFDLAAVMEAGVRGDKGRFHSFGDMFFFDKPMLLGKKHLNAALAEQPTLIVGLDFLFWFAYGAEDHEGKPIESREQRFTKLEAGLALLSSVECPLVLGDIADMSAAVGTMLLPSYVPDPETLAILNGKLYEWADERENVIVIPLAATVARIQSDRELVIGDYVWPAGSRATLIAEDKLHSTIEGTIALAQLIATRLAEAGLVDAAAFDLEPEKVLARLRQLAIETDRHERKLIEAQAKKGEPVPAGG